MHNKLLLSLIITGCCFMTGAKAQPTSHGERAEKTAEQIGLDIAQARYDRFKGYNDYEVSMTMVLKSNQGATSTYKMRSKALEVDNDGDKSLIVFQYPRDQKGIALLAYTHRVGADDQMLYLPSIKRVKRIAATNKSGPFMGSEFAYEDLSSKEVEKASYRFLREETFNGQEAYVTERKPKSEYSGYTRMVVWTDKEHYRILRADYYDRKDTLLKTLEYKNYQSYDQRFWRADTAVMTNHQTSKVTMIDYNDWTFTQGFKASDFTRNALKRMR